MIVDQAVYVDGVRKPCSDLRESLQKLRATGSSQDFLWVGLKDPQASEFNEVNDALGLHPLAIEDAVQGRQRVKFERYDGVNLVVLRQVHYLEASSDIETTELIVMIGDRYVLTVRRGDASPLHGVRERLEADAELLAGGPYAVLYAILDHVIDNYLSVDGEVQNDVEEMENDFFADGEVDTEAIYRLKREILEFKRAVAPLNQLIRSLYSGLNAPVQEEELRLRYRDVEDHTQWVADQIDNYDRLLSDILNAHLSTISVRQSEISLRQNEDMRRISAWAALAAVPTLIAGVYGMNFKLMPELTASVGIAGRQFYYGYFLALALMLGVCIWLYRRFNRTGWL